MRFWHIAHPDWEPGEPLICRDSLLQQGIEIEWLWDEADDGTDCDRVCLFPDTEQGRTEAGWLLGDRPDYHIVCVDLPDDYKLSRATWEDYPAVLNRIPAEYLTKMNEIA